jgi:hypothetical protein
MGRFRDVNTFAKVIFLFHNIGQAFMTDVEKVNKGLYVTLLQEVHADHLLVKDFVVVIVDRNAVGEDMLGSIFFIIF